MLMLAENEIKVLRMMNAQKLVKVSEMKRKLGLGGDGLGTALQRLITNECVQTIEPMGERCYIITPKGSKYLKEFSSPEMADAEGSNDPKGLVRTFRQHV